MKQFAITPKFVELIPSEIQDGVLYISEKYGTAIHKCCCGCGHEVVTPLSPVSWKLNLERNGSVSLYPSIGNWNFQCQSHYWIRKNAVIWAASISKREIRFVQERDKLDLERFIFKSNEQKMESKQNVSNQIEEELFWKCNFKSWLNWFRAWWKN